MDYRHAMTNTPQFIKPICPNWSIFWIFLKKLLSNVHWTHGHFIILYFAQPMGLKDFLVLFLMAMTSFKFENGGDNRTKGLLSTRQTKAGKVGGFGKPFCCWGSKPEHELRFCSTTAVHLPFNVCSASVATASISFQLTILEEFFFMRQFFFLSGSENVYVWWSWWCYSEFWS